MARRRRLTKDQQGRGDRFAAAVLRRAFSTAPTHTDVYACAEFVQHDGWWQRGGMTIHVSVNVTRTPAEDEAG